MRRLTCVSQADRVTDPACAAIATVASAGAGAWVLGETQPLAASMVSQTLVVHDGSLYAAPSRRAAAR
jgi:hypothetical protein